MQLPREPRFRPVQMVDEWPFVRTHQNQTCYQGPAQRDNIKEILYEEPNNNNNNNNNKSQRQPQPLERRDPNQQSDPIAADQEHPWNRCRIKKVDPPQPKEAGHGKKVNHFDINNNNNNALSASSSSNVRPNSSSVAPWDHPNSMTALQKKYSNYEYPLSNNNNGNSRERSVESNFSATTTTTSSSSASCASAARRRAQVQAQGNDWFALTKASPFEQVQNNNQNNNYNSEEFYSENSMMPKATPQVVAVGEPTHLRNYYSASEQRLTSSKKLIQQMQILARTTGRCNSELWQSCLEGHILRKPFSQAPTTRDVLRNYNNVNKFNVDCDESSKNNHQRLRKTVPFVEVIVQIEDALGQQVCDKALADVLGLGEFCNDNTPVRYEHFLKLFNA